jgi:alanyl-tRNA synthetase
VDSQRLRFDFTHFNKLNQQQLDRVEEIVNEYILLNTPLGVDFMELAEAKKKGALAFFAEKYEEKVRVVSIGDYSMELCGGTHLKSTSQIGIFKIISESAVSQGIRRIEAVTSKKAYELFKQSEKALSDIAELLKVSPDKISERAKSITKELSDLHKKYGNLKLEEFKNSLPNLIKQAKQKDSFKVFTQKFSEIDQGMLRAMVDLALKEIGAGVVCFASHYEDRVFLVMGLTKNLVDKGLNASDLIKDIAGILGGSGGGRADFAQAGGTDYSKIDEALSKASQLLNKL